LLQFVDADCQTTYKSEKDLKKNAELLFKDDDFVAALPLFSQLLSLYPKDPNYSYKFGACLLMADKRDAEKPIKYLEVASKSPDVEKPVFYYLGLAYHYNYRFKDAINAYNQFLQGTPRSLQKKYDAARQIEMCYNGISLLSTVSDLYVLEKYHVGYRNFYRSYKASDLGGRFLALPAGLKSKVDVKKEENQIIFFSEKAKALYYSSYGPKELTGKDIYRVFKNADGSWGNPEKLPNTINTEYDEDYPFMLADGVTLFFSSKGHNSMGGYDIFRTVLDTVTKSWSKPENLDFAINTPFDDILFIPNPDMSSAYFASNRVSDVGMINVYKVHLEARAEKDMTALGDVFNLSKDDPAYKRSLELLNKRTKLEVNASEDMFEKATVVADNTEEENKISDNTSEIDTAANKPLSNQDIIKMAYKQSDELKTDLNGLKEKMNATKMVTEQRKQRVLVRMNDAKKAKNDAQRIKNPKEREDAIIEASTIQAEADRLQKESEVADNIYKDIQQKVKQKEIEVKNADTYAENVKKAIDSDSPEKALEILNQMNNELVSEDVSEYTDKSVEEIIADADKKIPEPSNEIADLSKEVSRLNGEAAKLRNEATQNKNKSMKDDLLAQAQGFENEAKQIQSELNQMTQAVVDNKIDSVVPVENNIQSPEKQALAKRTDDIINNFEENNKKLKNQYANLITQTKEKVNQSNTDYNKAQQVISEADLSTDKTVKEKKLTQARTLMESSEKNTIEAAALNSVANQLNDKIKNTSETQASLNDEIKRIKTLLDKNETAGAEKLIEATNKKFNVDNTVSLNDEKDKNDLLKKAENAESESKSSFATASNLYNKISENQKEIQNLKNSTGATSDTKEIEKTNKKIEQLENDNKKIKVDADKAYRKGNEKKFEAGKFKMQVTIITSVIPSDSVNKQATETAVQTNNDLYLMQNNLFNEQTKLKESEHNLEASNNSVKTEVKPEIKTDNKAESEKQRLNKMGDDVEKKYNETLETFVVKSDKLYQYAQQKSAESKQGLTQADKVLQNSQNFKDTTMKNQAINKANQLYKKSFELAQEAMAATNLAKDYEDQVSQLKDDKANLKNQIADAKKLVDGGNLKDADKQLQKLQDNYSTQNVEKILDNKIKQSAESNLNQKQTEAQNLVNLSQKQYEDAARLKDESNKLIAQAQNTNDQNQKTTLLNNADQLQQQASASKKQADDTYNKGEKVKIEVGVLRMKVDFTVRVEEMPEAKASNQTAKANSTNDIAALQNTIEKHNFSETNKEAVKLNEEQKQTAQLLTTEKQTQKQPEKQPEKQIEKQPEKQTEKQPEKQLTHPKSNDIKQLMEDVDQNSQLAAEEKKKAAATNDQNKRMDIIAKANEYEQNAKGAQLQVYNIQSKTNKEQIDKNKSTIKEKKIVNEDDENSKRGKMLEAESDVYAQKADNRRKEAEKTDNTALKANIMEDVVRNEQLALQKQEQAIDNYKKAQLPVKQTTAQLNPVKDNNNQVNNKTTEQPVKNNQANQTNQIQNKTNPATNLNTKTTQPVTEDKALITNIKGLFFTVQIGVFAGARTAEQLFNLVPVYYDKLNNGNYRYFSGVFNSKEAAVSAKNSIVDKGIKDAFVVAFNDGTRLTVNEGLALLQNGKAKLQSQLAFTSQTAAPGVDRTNAKTTTTGFYYAVQIGVYKQQRPSAQMRNISPIEYESLPNGFQRHLTGHFNNRQLADNTKDEIVRKGITDAFVVAYLNGRRITLAEAHNYESGQPIAQGNQIQNNTVGNNTAGNKVNNGNNANNANNATNVNNVNQTKPATTEIPDYKPKDISYKVQIGAFKQSVEPLIIKQYKAMLNEKITEIKTDAGLIVYVVGSFKDFTKAGEFRNKVVSSGINDAFIVAYNKDKRIPLNVAREILKQ